MYSIFKQWEELEEMSQHTLEVHSNILFVYLSIGAHFTLQNVYKKYIPLLGMRQPSMPYRMYKLWI